MKPQAIKALRKRLELTADKFAERLGLTGKWRGLTVYKWESGKKRPSFQTLMFMGVLAQQKRPNITQKGA